MSCYFHRHSQAPGEKFLQKERRGLGEPLASQTVRSQPCPSSDGTQKAYPAPQTLVMKVPHHPLGWGRVVVSNHSPSRSSLHWIPGRCFPLSAHPSPDTQFLKFLLGEDSLSLSLAETQYRPRKKKSFFRCASILFVTNKLLYPKKNAYFCSTMYFVNVLFKKIVLINMLCA